MSRPVLDETRLHSAIRARVAAYQAETIGVVESALAKHQVVVVGMAINPFPKKACKALITAGIPFHYLEYGSYFSDWRRRTALKIWSGWPTFPMIFVKGVLIGGADGLQKLLDSGAFEPLLA